MPQQALQSKAEFCLHTLCEMKPSRTVGSKGNRAATDFATLIFESYGYDVDTTDFPCLNFRRGTASLTSGDNTFEVIPSPFSVQCDVTANLAVVETIDELEKKILTLRGFEVMLDSDLAELYGVSTSRAAGLGESAHPARTTSAIARWMMHEREKSERFMMTSCSRVGDCTGTKVGIGCVSIRTPLGVPVIERSRIRMGR